MLISKNILKKVLLSETVLNAIMSELSKTSADTLPKKRTCRDGYFERPQEEVEMKISKIYQVDGYKYVFVKFDNELKFAEVLKKINDADLILGTSKALVEVYNAHKRLIVEQPKSFAPASVSFSQREVVVFCGARLCSGYLREFFNETLATKPKDLLIDQSWSILCIQQ